jgi:hypothetical protein
MDTLLACLRSHIPVVCNLYLYANQARFFDSHDLLVSGYARSHSDAHVRSKRGDSDMTLVSSRPRQLIDNDNFTSPMRQVEGGIASPFVTMPSRKGSKLGRGHCIILTGMFEREGRLLFKCRNSFGRRWGLNGDFSIRAEDICPEQVHKLVWIHPDDASVELFRPFE